MFSPYDPIQLHDAKLADAARRREHNPRPSRRTPASVRRWAAGRLRGLADRLAPEPRTIRRSTVGLHSGA